MKVQLLLFAFSLALIMACDNKSAELKEDNNLAYEISSTSKYSDFAVQEAFLKADSGGHLYAHVKLLNRSRESISISPMDWELETETGLRSFPVTVRDSLTILSPRSVYLGDFIFEPVNSLSVYHFTGLKGDLNRHYKINFKQDLLRIEFLLSEELYKVYQEKWSMEKDLILFRPEIYPDFVKNQIEYLSKKISMRDEDPERKEHGVQATEEEILIDGLNANFSSYSYKDTLTMRIRFTNHSPFVVSTTSSLMKILMDSIPLDRVNENRADYYEIPKSQRASIELKYLFPYIGASTFALDLSATTFHTPVPVQVYYTNKLFFKRSEFEPSHEK